MTTPELKEVAKLIPGVTGVTAMKKEELLALIKEFRGIRDEEPDRKAKKKGKKKDLNVKELKKKVVQLKEEKVAAQKSRDKKRTDILRRRINRTKKQTRKVAHA
ncbi:MAG: transcription termination factor Rho [Deltaproteobacteria bacterium]|nr:transcription termination factor Rho [Deltaproteobacteria bacterium]